MPTRHERRTRLNTRTTQTLGPGVGALVLLLGCAPPERDSPTGTSVTGADSGATRGSDGGSGSGDPPGDGESDGGDGGTGDADTTGGDTGGGESGDDGGIRLDVAGGGPGGGEGGGAGCHKVDFLFVVDNSSSMWSVQQSLNASFPGFIQTIRDRVEGNDYHVMVVDSDDDPTWYCEPSAQGNDPACTTNCSLDCVHTQGDINCSGYPCGARTTVLDAQDKTLGCGVVRPYGGRASNRDCGVEGGRRYMTASQPDLETTFQCAATVGVSGHWWERPATSMVRALSPDFNGPGGCNEGFLRDDAILVAVFISDDMTSQEDDDDVKPGVNGTPQEWFDQVLAAKGGNREAIVMLGIVSRPGNVFGVPVSAQKFMDFFALFGPQGMTAFADEPDYTPFFQQAVDLIDLTCDNFVPPG